MIEGRYRISQQTSDRRFPWRLEWLERANSGYTIRSARCVSMRSAQSLAAEIDLRRARNLRASAHGVVALASLYCFLWLSSTDLQTITAFGIALLCLAVAMRSVGNVIGAKRLDLWGWQPDTAPTPSSSRFDRCCRWAVRHVGPSIADTTMRGKAQVRVLPPVD